MKCEVCSELLEEYLDGELAPADHEQVDAHLITCSDCSATFAALTAEQDLFSRYDREIEVPPFLWTRVAAHTVSESNQSEPNWRASFAAAIAVVLLAIVISVAYLVSREKPISKPQVAEVNDRRPVENRKTEDKAPPAAPRDNSVKKFIASRPKARAQVRPVGSNATLDQSDVLSSDLGYLDMEDRDTAMHIEQTQNLLRSIRNVSLSDGDEEIDVTYDKALSRRLLNENVVLRRDAEMKAKFPTKTLLADLEPFLIDIANLPDCARPEDVRVIKERVQKTEIVAALLGYQDRGTNNR